MRLTLRTLLAWMDGLLPAADQEELGAKVAASPIAPRLVERIRDVMARPGLVAPRPDGRGLADDPNTIAEFLDNVLPADQLELFERVCIESDMHLAEAADCHAVLAEMARNPSAIAPLDRRLHKRLLDHVGRAGQQQADLPAPSRSQARARAHEDAAATVAAIREAVEAGHMVGRAGPALAGRRASWAAWVSAGVAALLLLGLVGLLARTLLVSPAGGRDVVAVRDDKPQAAAVVTEPPAPVAPGHGAQETTPATPDTTPAPSDDEPEPQLADGPATPGPTAVAAVPVPEPRVVPEPPRPNPPPTVPLPQMELPDGEPIVPEAGPAAAAVAPGAVAEGGALLHRVGEGDEAEWKPLAPGDQLGEVEEFAVPAHSFPRVTRTRGDISIRLHPGSLAALVTDANGVPRIEVVFGRAVAWTEAAEATLGITAGGLSGVVVLGPRQAVGVEVDLLRDPGTDPAVVPPGRRAIVHTSGGLRWRQTEVDGGPPGQPLAGLEIEEPLPPRGELVWTSADPATAKKISVGRSPDWLQAQAAATRPEQAAGLELALRLAAGDDLEATLRTMAADRKAENRVAAAITAALIGDYEPAVGLLCADSPELKLRDGQWTSLEAATVQQALARGANAAAKVREAFAAQAPAGRGDELFLLARGLSREELATGGAAMLVESLADGSLVIRRYAFHDLLAVFPEDPTARIEYRPDRPPGLNDKALEWWRRKVAEAVATPVP